MEKLIKHSFVKKKEEMLSFFYPMNSMKHRYKKRLNIDPIVVQKLLNTTCIVVHVSSGIWEVEL